MRTVQGDAAARRRARLGSWMFWGTIVAFEFLGAFLANHRTWEAEDLTDEAPYTGPTILIVADDDTQRLRCRERFEHEGYTVLEARNGNEALARIDRQPPDAVVLDIDALGPERLHTLARIHERNPRLPVLLNGAATDVRTGPGPAADWSDPA